MTVIDTTTCWKSPSLAIKDLVLGSNNTSSSNVKEVIANNSIFPSWLCRPALRQHVGLFLRIFELHLNWFLMKEPQPWAYCKLELKELIKENALSLPEMCWGHLGTPPESFAGYSKCRLGWVNICWYTWIRTRSFQCYGFTCHSGCDAHNPSSTSSCLSAS